MSCVSRAALYRREARGGIRQIPFFGSIHEKLLCHTVWEIGKMRCTDMHEESQIHRQDR
jgi:hypothetical protein